MIVFEFKFCLTERKVKLNKTVHIFVLVPKLYGQIGHKSHSPDCSPIASGLSKKRSSMNAAVLTKSKLYQFVCKADKMTSMSWPMLVPTMFTPPLMNFQRYSVQMKGGRCENPPKCVTGDDHGGELCCLQDLGHF